MIIGLVGFISAGKGIAGHALKDLGFVEDSFAAPLKDALSAIFGWERHLLEGDTTESREFREQIDPWWAKKLNIQNFSPRKAMQNISTDVFRKYFNDDLWMLSLERRFLNKNSNKVITDVRFRNELKLIKNLGGKIIRIKKGPEPEWYETALENNTTKSGIMEIKYPNIHISEWDWIGSPDIDLVIENDGTIEDLNIKIKNQINQWMEL